MATDPETMVRVALERACVAASDDEIKRLAQLVTDAGGLTSPGRTVEPHLAARAKEWRK